MTLQRIEDLQATITHIKAQLAGLEQRLPTREMRAQYDYLLCQMQRYQNEIAILERNRTPRVSYAIFDEIANGKDRGY